MKTKETLYRLILVDKDGNSNIPVNYVGVYPLHWEEADKPEVAFIEIENDELSKYIELDK